MCVSSEIILQFITKFAGQNFTGQHWIQPNTMDKLKYITKMTLSVTNTYTPGVSTK